jgi:hypothetical protein
MLKSMTQTQPARTLFPGIQCTSLLLLVAALNAHAELRELSTDRPDTTESPYTVDKGHYQIEMEPISWARDKNDGVKTTTIGGSYNLKFGIADNADLQLVLSPYNHIKTESDGEKESRHGIGDTDIRAKINFWGNDGGDTAFALMPFVTLPTDDSDLDPDDDDHNEYGLIAPLAFKLPHDWDAAVMLEVDRVRNADDDGYTLSWVESITTSHAITGDWSCFFELVNIHTRDNSAAASDDDERYFNTGVTYGLTEFTQLDFGTNIGLTDSSEDVRFFVGFSLKQ